MRRLVVDKWLIVAMFLIGVALTSELFLSLDPYQPYLFIGIASIGVVLLCLTIIRELLKAFSRRKKLRKGNIKKK